MNDEQIQVCMDETARIMAFISDVRRQIITPEKCPSCGSSCNMTEEQITRIAAIVSIVDRMVALLPRDINE